MYDDDDVCDQSFRLLKVKKVAKVEIIVFSKCQERERSLAGFGNPTLGVMRKSLRFHKDVIINERNFESLIHFPFSYFFHNLATLSFLNTLIT